MVENHSEKQIGIEKGYILPALETVICPPHHWYLNMRGDRGQCKKCGARQDFGTVAMAASFVVRRGNGKRPAKVGKVAKVSDNTAERTPPASSQRVCGLNSLLVRERSIQRGIDCCLRCELPDCQTGYK